MYLQVAVCGAVVMLVEILGTRIVGPVFGVGLFVWSALLGGVPNSSQRKSWIISIT